MVDIRGDVLRPPHGTTPAAVKSNKNQQSRSRKNKKIQTVVEHGLFENDYLRHTIIWADNSLTERTSKDIIAYSGVT